MSDSREYSADEVMNEYSVDDILNDVKNITGVADNEFIESLFKDADTPEKNDSEPWSDCEAEEENSETEKDAEETPGDISEIEEAKENEEITENEESPENPKSVFEGFDDGEDDEDEDEDLIVFQRRDEETESNTQKEEKETQQAVSQPEDDVKVYNANKENPDFSFEKMYEEKKKEKERRSRTRVFKKADEEDNLLTESESETDKVSEKEEKLEKEFKEKRQKKIDKFRLFTENLGDDSFGEEEPEGTVISNVVKTKKGEDIFAAIENTDKPKKENSKRREKRKRRDSKVYDKIDVGRVKLRLDEEAREIKIRKITALISFVLCLVIGVMKSGFVSGRIDFLSSVMIKTPVVIYALELVFTLPLLIFSVKALLWRVRENEKFSLCSEAMLVVLLLANTLHSALLVIIRPETDKSVMLFGTAVCFISLLSVFGQSRENKMIKRNLEAIIRNERIMGVFALESESEKIASGISKQKEPMVLCAGEVEIPNSFLDSSMTKDKENAFFNIAVPVSLILSVVCGVLAFVSYGGILSFSSAALSALLVSAPAFAAPVLVSLIARTNETLNRTGCEILGYEDVENIDDTDAIVLDTADIFTGNISHFHLISRNVRIDTLHAFEIACSILYSSGGVLRGEIAEFMKEQKLILPEVEDMKYEEKLGISCWVEDKCVLLGTEQMMKEHNIEIPAEYSGSKYEREGSKVFYLAVDTYATAMFCADYFIGRQARKQLVDLYKTGVILMLMTTDPHIDEQFVANTLGVSPSSIKTVSPVGAKQIRDSISHTARQKRTGLIFRKSVVGLLKVINAAFRLYDVQSLTFLVQIVSMVFAIVVSGVLSAAATGYFPGVVFIIAYHLIWTALGYFVTHKNKK